MGFGTIIGLFSGKTAKFAWGGLALVLAIGFGWWAITTISHLRRENASIALEVENRYQRAALKAQAEEQARFNARVEEMNASIDRLNQSLARNSAERRRSYESMTGPATRRPDGSIDTKPLEDRANTGMNALFRDLEEMSR